MERWEHMQISTGADDIAKLPAAIEDLGCYGWELAGFTSSAASGGNSGVVIAILKRPMVLPHDPHDRSEGWKSDPCGRWDARWWDGQAWTFYVERRNGDGVQSGRDAPTMQPVFKRSRVQ